jgi:ABC-type transporter Mla subunit MlaD
MTAKLASNDADRILARLDRIAATVQDKYASWGMPFETAKEVVNALDKTADEIEAASFGADSLAKRQAEVLSKTAKVIQRDADEAYMDAFKNPMQPHQVEADERYMSLYKDDQSSAVGSGEASSGRKLAPQY